MEALSVRPPDIARSMARLRLGTPPVMVEAALADPPAVTRPNRAPRILPVGPAALAVRDLTHTYADGTRALDGVTLDLARGSFTVIAGRNGSGKSTLVRHFVGLLRPGAGRVEVAGQDVAGLSIGALAQNIGFVAQNAHRQLFCDSVVEEVSFALKMQKRPPTEVEAAVARAIVEMGLADVVDMHPAALSRGTQLRIAIAAFLALDPQVLIFDEPTTGQDWRGATAVIDVLRRLQGAGRTVVLVTHHLYLLGRFVDRMIVMDRGRVQLDGPPEAVLYAGDRLEACGVVPPQTVQLAAGLPGLAGFRPIGPDDLEVP
jgi:energy-coupling factor transport system ATP-binding protein